MMPVGMMIPKVPLKVKVESGPASCHHEAAQAGRPGESDDGAEQDEADAAQGQAASSLSRVQVRLVARDDRVLASHDFSGLCVWPTRKRPAGRTRSTPADRWGSQGEVIEGRVSTGAWADR